MFIIIVFWIGSDMPSGLLFFLPVFLKINSAGKMQLAICCSGSSHLHIWRQKPNCSSHIVTQLRMCSLASFKRLINVGDLLMYPNTTDHINVVFRKSVYSLMSRESTSLNSIVTAAVNWWDLIAGLTNQLLSCWVDRRIAWKKHWHSNCRRPLDGGGGKPRPVLLTGAKK